MRKKIRTVRIYTRQRRASKDGIGTAPCSFWTEQRKVDLDQVNTVVWPSLDSGSLRIACMLRTDRMPRLSRALPGNGAMERVAGDIVQVDREAALLPVEHNQAV
jgi:hypothetical protein